jgi:hypothetical protein
VLERPRPHPPGWTPSDSVLEARIEADEERIAAEERWVRRNWRLALALALLLGLTIAALVVGMLALNRDIESVAKAEPKDDSVGTSALQSGAVTSDKIAAGAVGAAQLAAEAVGAGQLAAGAVTSGKLAEGAVTGIAIAPRAVGNLALAAEAVGTKKLVPGAVTGGKVAADTLTGANILEASLGEVPWATNADKATNAGNAAKLGGLQAGAYLYAVELAQATSEEDLQPVKQVSATCPTGTRIVSGGAAVEGAPLGKVAIVASTPDADAAWLAVAAALDSQLPPWQLVVTAICAGGGG